MRAASILAIVGVAAGSTGLAAVTWLGVNTSDRKALAELKTAFAHGRPFEARLTGGFRHAPVTGVLRSEGGRRDLPSRLMLDHTRASLARDASIGARRTAAVVDLIDGRHDEAVERLKGLLLEYPRDARTWNDLAVALLVRGRPDDAPGALSASSHALAQQSTMPEALFNHGLALEQLGLARAALRSWRAYLAHTPSSQWDAEARHHIKRLESAASADDWTLTRSQLQTALTLSSSAADSITSRHPQETREWIADEALTAWAASQTGGADAAPPSLPVLAALASSLAERGDDTAAEAVRMISMADPAGRVALARGHAAYGRGHHAFSNYGHAEAVPLFREAMRQFGPAHPLSFWAQFNLAVVSYRNAALDEAEMSLAGLRKVIPPQRYPALHARIDWIQGLIEGNRGNTSAEGRAFRRSLAAFERLRETENTAVVRSLLAESAEILGDLGDAWRHLAAALPHLPRMRQRSRQLAVLFVAADTAMKQDRPEVALPFYDEFLRVSIEMNSSEAVAEAYLQRARAQVRLGRRPEARSDLALARAALAAAGPTGSSAFLVAQLQAMEATELASDDPIAASARLESSIAYFERTGRTAWLTRSYLARARLMKRTGRWPQAEAELRRGIDVFETLHQRIDSGRHRISYQEDLWELFQEIVNLLVTQGRHGEAFAFAERGRGRERSPATVNPSLDSVTRAIPTGTLVVYYAETSEGLVAWAIDRSHRAFVTTRPDDLSAHVARFRSALQAGDMRTAARAGESLRAALLEPLRERLASTERVIFVPDGALHQLPFSALPFGAAGEPLLRSHVVSVVPSAKVLLAVQSVHRSSQPGPRSVFVAANPARGSTAVAALPGTEMEAREIANLYPSARLFVGASATREAVLRGVESSDIIHLGSHAFANTEFPELSRFLFAPAGGSDEMSVVLAQDFERVRFEKAQLVVLAACDTATGRITKSEGALSLARPFLSGGVPSVVATLWPVDDRAARALFTTLHREVRDGRDPAAALRIAQLEVLDNPAFLPGAWAAPVVFGGSSQQ